MGNDYASELSEACRAPTSEPELSRCSKLSDKLQSSLFVLRFHISMHFVVSTPIPLVRHTANRLLREACNVS